MLVCQKGRRHMDDTEVNIDSSLFAALAELGACVTTVDDLKAQGYHPAKDLADIAGIAYSTMKRRLNEGVKAGTWESQTGAQGKTRLAMFRPVK